MVAKIFSIVNPNLEYFRKKNQSHSLESAIQFLLEIISSSDPLIKKQIEQQLSCVLGDTRYSQLHNNLRYPAYFTKYDSYSILEIKLKDYNILKERLNLLKDFLNDLHMINN